MTANGIRILRISSAPWENGLKTGISRDTLSREKDETEAMLPVLKKADWRRKRKKRAIRASEMVRPRWVCDLLLSEADGDTCPTGSTDGSGFGLEPLGLLVVAIPLEDVGFDASTETSACLDDGVAEKDEGRI